MGRMPSLDRKYQLQALNTLHHEVLRYSLLGLKPKQIATALGITEATVANVTNGAKGRMQLAILSGVRDSQTLDIAKDIQEFAGEAWGIAKDLIRDANQPAALRLKYAFETIGIVGHVKPQRVQTQGVVAHLTGPEIDAIKQRAKQLAIENGVIDADYVESTELSQGRLSEGQETSSLESEEAQLPGATEQQLQD